MNCVKSSMRDSRFYSEMHDTLSNCFIPASDKPEETVGTTLDALWALATETHLSVEMAGQHQLPKLNKAQKVLLIELIKNISTGTPLAHLTGVQRFMGLDMGVSPDALIPRKETELLGYGALKLIQESMKKEKTALVVDICTGAGNLAIAFAFHEPKVRVFGSDLSPKAIELATQNAEALDLANRIEFSSGDLLEPFRSESFMGQIDVLTCNPPYISSGKLESMPKEIIDHEPDIAFDGGPFGISILSRLLKEAPEFVKTGGWLAFEVGAGQGPGIQRMLQKNSDFGEVRVVNDHNGQIRALLAQVT